MAGNDYYSQLRLHKLAFITGLPRLPTNPVGDMTATAKGTVATAKDIGSGRFWGNMNHYRNENSTKLDAAQDRLRDVSQYDPTPFSSGANAAMSAGRAVAEPWNAGSHLENAGTAALGAFNPFKKLRTTSNIANKVAPGVSSRLQPVWQSAKGFATRQWDKVPAWGKTLGAVIGAPIAFDHVTGGIGAGYNYLTGGGAGGAGKVYDPRTDTSPRGQWNESLSLRYGSRKPRSLGAPPTIPPSAPKPVQTPAFSAAPGGRPAAYVPVSPQRPTGTPAKPANAGKVEWSKVPSDIGNMVKTEGSRLARGVKSVVPKPVSTPVNPVGPAGGVTTMPAVRQRSGRDF